MQFGQYQPNITGMPMPMPMPEPYGMGQMNMPSPQFDNIENRLSRLEQQARRLNARVSRLEMAVQEPIPEAPQQFQSTQPFEMTEGNYPSTYMI